MADANGNVTESNEGNNSNSITINVGGSQTPTISIAATQITITPPSPVPAGTTITLSFPPVTGAKSYKFYYGTAPGKYVASTPVQLSNSFTVQANWDLYVVVKAVDGNGVEGVASNEVHIVAATASSKPVAVINATPLTGTTPLTVTLDASGSTQGNSPIASYKWTSSDGQSASGKTTSLVFNQAGTYQVTLRVSDGVGNEAIEIIKISVAPLDLGNCNPEFTTDAVLKIPYIYEPANDSWYRLRLSGAVYQETDEYPIDPGFLLSLDAIESINEAPESCGDIPYAANGLRLVIPHFSYAKENFNAILDYVGQSSGKHQFILRSLEKE